MNAFVVHQVAPVSQAERTMGKSGMSLIRMGREANNRAEWDDPQAVGRDAEQCAEEVPMALRGHQQIASERELRRDLFLTQLDCLLDLRIALPGLPFDAGETQGGRGGFLAEVAESVLAVKPGTGAPPVMEGDNSRDRQLRCERDNVVGEPKPVMNVNDIGPDCGQMLADQDLGLRVIGVNLSFPPFGRERAHIASDADSLFVRRSEGWLSGPLI